MERIAFWLGALAILCGSALSQRTVDYNRITTEDHGLSQNSVRSIVQDRHGFMWFGTEDGLNRFDGYQMMVFRSAEADTNSISGNRINDIIETSTGDLWVASASGLDRYDSNLNNFESFAGLFRTRPIVTALATSQDRIWASTRSGEVVGISLDLEELDVLRFEVPELNASPRVHELVVDPAGDVWIATNEGIVIITPEDRTIRRLLHDPRNPKSLPENNVNAMLVASSGDVWAGSVGGHLGRFAPDGAFDYWNIGEGSLIYSITEYKDDLLVGTSGSGLCNFSLANKDYHCQRHDPDDAKTLQSDIIFDVYVDRGGVEWVGGFGLNYADISAPQFQHYRYVAGESKGLSSPQVWSVLEAQDKSVWVATTSGLNRLDPETNTFSFYEHDPQDSTSASEGGVFSLNEDRDGTLWVGTWRDGLSHMDKQGRFQHYRHDPSDPSSISGNAIIAMAQDEWDQLWIGSLTGGLDRYVPESDSFEAVDNLVSVAGEGIDAIYSLFIDSRGILWVGTNGRGLARMKLTSGGAEMVPFDKLEAALDGISVLSFTEGEGDIVWIGTLNEGLWSYDLNTKAFERFREEDGSLPNGTIYGVLEDESGFLWLSTNAGVICLDPKTREAIAFGPNRGAQSLEFNQGAYELAEDGTMYFGGTNGLNRFRPSEMQGNPYPATPVLTSLQSFGEAVEPGPESIIEESITTASEIVTNYDAKGRLTFGFSGVHYASPASNLFQYQLEGFDAGWSDPTSETSATYTNIGPGHYTFRLRAANSDGLWSENEATVSVRVIPPWYQRWWAYTLFALSGLGMIAGFIHVRTVAARRELERKQRELDHERKDNEIKQTRLELREKELRQERLASAKLREVDRLKTSFLENMSHELRTPLTSILGFSELIQIEDDVEEIHGMAGLIESGAQRLEQTLTSVLDLAQLEGSSLELSRERLDLAELACKIASGFEHEVAQKGIKLECKSTGGGPVHIVSDRAAVERILDALLSNAVRFTNKGIVSVLIETSEEHATVAVTDTGIGIDVDFLPQIFQTFRQESSGLGRSHEGNGLGLPIAKHLVDLLGGTIQVRSKKGSGSTFEVRIPVDERAEFANTMKVVPLPTPSRSEVSVDRPAETGVRSDEGARRGRIERLRSRDDL